MVLELRNVGGCGRVERREGRREDESLDVGREVLEVLDKDAPHLLLAHPAHCPGDRRMFHKCPDFPVHDFLFFTCFLGGPQ
jgi:hypothetical protein